MSEPSKLLYILVVDDEGTTPDKPNACSSSFWYTRPVLQNTLQFMGCKPRHAFKISRRVFEVVQSENQLNIWPPVGAEELGVERLSGNYEEGSCCGDLHGRKKIDCLSFVGEKSNEIGGGARSFASGRKILPLGGERQLETSFDCYKRCTAFVKRESFLDTVCGVLADYKYVGPSQRDDLVLACRVRERKESVTVLLCGTSGCGKSTLSALLGSRLGITTVISTDSIRHMMRSFVSEDQNPLLWASTYHAGECLDPIAVAEAKAKKKANKLTHIEEVPDGILDGKPLKKLSLSTTAMISAKQMAVEGYKAQSEMVIESLDRLITAWERRKESVVVEGVHLSLNFVTGLMRKHPSIIPFMIYIENESKHLERFAVRAKYMTLDPSKNKYVKYFQNIRTIQDYLCKQADKHLVPKINNTNVDRSVAAIHATVFSCLRRRETGEQFYDPTTNTVSVVDEAHRNQCFASSLGSKGVFQLIQRQGSSRHMMALISNDGSVAKAWSLDASAANPLYGPFNISKTESVNLQFGDFGLSAWPSDIGASGHATTVDDSYLDGVENESRYISSSCSSPRMSDGPAKEIKERSSVSGSDEDEEAENLSNTDTDTDDKDNKEIHEEGEGSVDEDSGKSDDEYEDLAIKDY